MKKYDSAKSSLFLMELLLSIFIFMIAGAVCLQLFAKAYRMNQNVQESNEALFHVQSVAEQLRGVEENSQIKAYYPEAEWSGDGFAVYYSGEWEISTQEKAKYGLFVTFSEDQQRGAVIAVQKLDSHETVYELEVRYHRPYERASETEGEA